MGEVKWYLWLILAALVVLTAFAWVKAMSASRKRRERLKKEAEIWKRDYDMRQKFSVLTELLIDSTDDSELLHGVAMNIQITLENAPMMDEAFASLPKAKKRIYALEYFNEDATVSLSTFFRNNGAPLTPEIPDALKEIGMLSLLAPVMKLFPMFDGDSAVSVDEAVIKETNREFADIFNSNELMSRAADYIRQNKAIFTD